VYIYIYLYSNIPRRESLLTNQYNYWGLSQYSIHQLGMITMQLGNSMNHWCPLARLEVWAYVASLYEFGGVGFPGARGWKENPTESVSTPSKYGLNIPKPIVVWG
jgi:hypothetical protein